jgi:hypothetical protein
MTIFIRFETSGYLDSLRAGYYALFGLNAFFHICDAGFREAALRNPVTPPVHTIRRVVTFA